MEHKSRSLCDLYIYIKIIKAIIATHSLTHPFTYFTDTKTTRIHTFFHLINSPYLINNLVQIKKEKNVKTETLAFERNAKTKTKKRKKGRTKYYEINSFSQNFAQNEC